MFGYIKTDIPNMYVKDTVLYRSMYCGLCKGIGCSCGTKARFTLTYDLTFFSILMHNLLNKDVKIEKQRCILHWIISKPIAKTDDLTEKIGALNVILAYYKLKDDVFDENKGKISSGLIKSNYKKAVKLEPKLDEIVKNSYLELVKLEKENCTSTDICADPFGKMMVELTKYFLQDKFDDNISLLVYNLGKWIYLIDALDDFDKDIKHKSFNVFVNKYGKDKDKKTFIKENVSDLEWLFGSVLSDIKMSGSKLKYNFNHDLIDNILNFGLLEQTKKILENKKCTNTTKY